MVRTNRLSVPLNSVEYLAIVNAASAKDEKPAAFIRKAALDRARRTFKRPATKGTLDA